MREPLLALLMSGLALAGQGASPTAAGLNDPALHIAGKAVRKSCARRSPFRFIRRLGEIQVNLAIRLSTVGIRDSEINCETRPVLKRSEVSK